MASRKRSDSDVPHSHYLQVRITEHEAMAFKLASKRDGFSSVSEWVRVNMNKVAKHATYLQESIDGVGT